MGVGVSLGLGDGVGLFGFFFVLLFTEGLGVAEGEGEAEFFLCFVRWRDGVGVGLTKICLIFSPTDGAAAGAAGAGSRTATIRPAATELVRRGRAIPGV